MSFLYPALLSGFAFVAVPLLVHLINMLRHRRRRWAAMDFLLASYRKQKKWLRLRQLLLLLSRLAIAAILVAMLCGWTGGRRLLGMIGGQTTHHLVILDDSYSMGDRSGGGESTSYDRALQALQQLTERLAGEDGLHQLTVMRASRAMLAQSGGAESGDVAADLSAQTVTGQSGLIARVMSTGASAVRTDLIAALDFAAQLSANSNADSQYLYVASDFRQRDWGSTERISESLRKFDGSDLKIRFIDCARLPERNLAVTDLEPVQDVWVAGVPVVVRATIKNYSSTEAKNVTLAARVIRYGRETTSVDPSQAVSGTVESLPGIVIESLDGGAEVTRTFQVFITETGTHAIQVELPSDALEIDNRRVCTLPLTEAKRVLIVDSDPNEAGARTLAAVLDPGSKVRIGAVPDIRPPSFLRSATLETLDDYRAIYLIDLPQITESAAVALDQFVREGGGLAWFLGGNVQANQYNRVLFNEQRQLLPAPLESIVELPPGGSTRSGDVVFGDEYTLLSPLSSAGDGSLAMIGVVKSWTLAATDSDSNSSDSNSSDVPVVREVLRRRDGIPLVAEHEQGNGNVVTVLMGLQLEWTNWPGDPTFVPFALLTNAKLWSGAAASTAREVSDPLVNRFSTSEFFPEVKLLAPTLSPPRVILEMTADRVDVDELPEPNSERVAIHLSPIERMISSDSAADDLLKPGIFEWGLLRADGGGVVIPSASTIAGGEGDLVRADANEIRQSLLPIDVQFVSSTDWSNQNQFAGSNSLGLILLLLLGVLLGIEQLLAYWASYHTRAQDHTRPGGTAQQSASGALAGTQPAFGLSASGSGGSHS